MNCYTLLRNVTYEGSTLLGVFASIEDIIEHLNNLGGYLMEGYTPTADDLESIDDEWELERVQNSIAVWNLDGPSDQSFTITAIQLGA